MLSIIDEEIQISVIFYFLVIRIISFETIFCPKKICLKVSYALIKNPLFKKDLLIIIFSGAFELLFEFFPFNSLIVDLNNLIVIHFKVDQ